jgi:hypothetical protein
MRVPMERINVRVGKRTAGKEAETREIRNGSVQWSEDLRDRLHLWMKTVAPSKKSADPFNGWRKSNLSSRGRTGA